MVHAFPKIKMEDPSFARKLHEPQYMAWISDGDLSMCTNMREGMGDGRAADNRSNIPTPIWGCAFHKYKTLKGMCTRELKLAWAAKKNGERHFGTFACSVLLDGTNDYDRILNGLVDICMNTDHPGVGILAWEMVLRKLKLIGMLRFALRLNKFHHPVTGRQGTWGRWNMVLEQALPETMEDMEDNRNYCSSHATVPRTTVRPRRQARNPTSVIYGTSSTSNPLEGRMNKLMKIATGTSMSYGPLSSKAQNMCTSLSRTMTEIVFSLVGDQQGECKQTHHRKESGRRGVQKTGVNSKSVHIQSPAMSKFSVHLTFALGRNYAERFMQGIKQANGPYHSIYNYRVTGEGATAEYYCASITTIHCVDKWLQYENKSATPSRIQSKLEILRSTWIAFQNHPQGHYEALMKVCAYWVRS